MLLLRVKWITYRTSALSTPIPNAMVATTTCRQYGAVQVGVGQCVKVTTHCREFAATCRQYLGVGKSAKFVGRTRQHTDV
jgi:hypothetical protein